MTYQIRCGWSVIFHSHVNAHVSTVEYAVGDGDECHVVMRGVRRVRWKGEKIKTESVRSLIKYPANCGSRRCNFRMQKGRLLLSNFVPFSAKINHLTMGISADLPIRETPISIRRRYFLPRMHHRCHTITKSYPFSGFSGFPKRSNVCHCTAFS